MPMNLRDYPPDWIEISRRVRFDRAKGRCEWVGCAARHQSTIIRQADGEPYRCRDGTPREIDDSCAMPELNPGDRSVLIILTTAHDCDCSPKCGNMAHLRALCQLHHLRLDDASHRRNSAATRRRREAERGQGFLISDIDTKG